MVGACEGCGVEVGGRSRRCRSCAEAYRRKEEALVRYEGDLRLLSLRREGMSLEEIGRSRSPRVSREGIRKQVTKAERRTALVADLVQEGDPDAVREIERLAARRSGRRRDRGVSSEMSRREGIIRI